MGPDMRPGIDFEHGKAYAATLLAAACTSVAASLLAAAACITAPPPDLPTPALVPPSIVHDAVLPPSDALLPPWPPPPGMTFVVPVQLVDPTNPFVFNVFVDYPFNQAPAYSGSGPSSGALLDGGISIVSFMLSAPDTALCPHLIELLVAYGFDHQSPHTINSLGGDIVTWLYYGGLNTGECPAYEAGSGLFSDGSPDALAVPPESGAGDP
jgi:hypothetical protein